jgi:hypothetical protein
MILDKEGPRQAAAHKSERQDEVEVENQRGEKKAKEDPLVASSHPPSPLTYALPKALAISDENRHSGDDSARSIQL